MYNNSMKKLKKIFAIVSIIGIISLPFRVIASTVPITPALYESSLSFPESTTDTSFTVVSNALQSGSLPNGYTCFTIDQGQPNTEYECGTVSGTVVSGVTRGIDPITGNTSNSALVFSHRRGADVKITDFPTLTLISRILAQQDTLAQPISYATGVNPVGNQDLATKAYVNSVVSGGTVTTNQVTVSGTAGTTISTGNLVYLNVADGRWYTSSASTTTTLYNVQLGIAQGSGTTGNAITNGILISGIDTHTTGTAGALAYSGNTSGSIVSSAGTNPMVVGQFVVSNGGIYFNPSFFYQITPNTQNALSGGGSFGSPSSSNKFITQTYLSTGTAIPTVQTFTSSGTYTAPAGLKYVVIEGVGGGGGGGSSGTSGVNAAGGGGGGYFRKLISSATLGSSQTITIGAGGTAGSAGNNAGNGGGTTSFGAISSATGGSGGSAGSASAALGGAGGVGSSGDINSKGQGGTGGVSGAGGTVFLSSGGSSYFGGGAAGGAAGSTYGGGGSGGTSGSTGNSGSAGFIIITEYYQ